MNAYVADECRKRPGRYGLMVAAPTMSARKLEEDIRSMGLLGFKPYWTLAAAALGKRQNDVTIFDMVSPAQIEVADRLGLIVMLTSRAPNAWPIRRTSARSANSAAALRTPRVVLAHLGRSYTFDSVRELPKYGRHREPLRRTSRTSRIGRSCAWL